MWNILKGYKLTNLQNRTESQMYKTDKWLPGMKREEINQEAGL